MTDLELIQELNKNKHLIEIGDLVISKKYGIGIRETTSKITNNTSRFVPHLIE
jgi:glutathionylspermidine synthase